MVTSFCKKDVIAQNMQNVISKYSKAVPIPSRNVRNAGFSRFASLYQRYTLSGSDLPYHFVGFPPHSTSPIPQGTFSTFSLTLSHEQIIYFYFADASARTSSDTASTCAVIGNISTSFLTIT